MILALDSYAATTTYEELIDSLQSSPKLLMLTIISALISFYYQTKTQSIKEFLITSLGVIPLLGLLIFKDMQLL